MQYGYGALFALLVAGIVGLPVPDETLLTLAGFLVYKGKFELIPMLLAGFLGSACGITVSYLIGRTAGIYTIHKFGRFLRVDDVALARVRHWYERFGKWILVVGYFIPGVRHFTALVAGASRLPYREFAIFAYVGALLWSSLFITIGYYFGRWLDARWRTGSWLSMVGLLVGIATGFRELIRIAGRLQRQSEAQDREPPIKEPD